MPNNLLRGLLAEAGWSGETLARVVNAAGAEMGIRLYYDRTAVSHWLAGVRPRPPVPELVAEVLSRRLGRGVTVDATGLRSSRVSIADGLSAGWQVDAVTRLAELAQPRRAMLNGLVYSVSALSVPRWIDLVATPHEQRRPATGSAVVGRAEVESAGLMTRLFADADATFGGGYARPALARYLHSTVVPWLRADGKPNLHRKLLITASRLAYLCGFMYFDDNQQGPAQHYYLSGLRLAAEAGDTSSYAIALRALSVQARSLGHHAKALDLAEAAVRTAPVGTPGQTQAFMLGQLAVAQAATDNRRAALSSLAVAEASLARAAAGSQSVGAYHPASLAHQKAAVVAALGDRRTAITALEHSIRHRPAAERRSRAITFARLAELQFADGQVERACETWHLFLDDYPSLQSRRVSSALVTLRARTRPYQNNAAVRALVLRATALRLKTAQVG